MAELGWTRADLESHSQAKRSLVAQWFGKSARPIQTLGVKPAIHLQDASGYSALWLAVGEGPKKLPPSGPADAAAVQLLRLYAGMDPISRARLLAYAADLSGKHRNAA